MVSRLKNLSMLLLSAFLLAGVGLAEAHTNPPPVSVDDQYEHFTVYELPVGSPIPVLLHTPVHTGVNQGQDVIEAAVAQDIYIYEKKIIHKNARLRGTITQITPPIQGRNAMIGFAFHEIMLSNGERIQLKAHIKTSARHGIFGGELTPGTEYERVTFRVMGIGEYNKAVLTGPRQMGSHIEFLPGTHWTLILDEPIVIAVPKDDLL